MKQFITLIMIWSYAGHAQTPPSTKSVMHEALNSLTELLPYMSSEMKFNDPNHHKYIEDHIQRIAMAFKSARHIKDFKSANFSPSFSVIQHHLDDTLVSFKSNDKTFARLKMNATMDLCLSCHTQLPSDKMTSFIMNSNSINEKIFEHSFDYANFLFLIRNYDQSIKTFEKVINERIETLKKINKISETIGETGAVYDKILHQSFKDILVIYTKILREPAKVINLFERYQANDIIPKVVRNDLSRWIEQLNKWKENPFLHKKFENDNQLNLFMKKYAQKLTENSLSLGTGDMDVDLLVITGILSNYLSTHHHTNKASEVLYWLGISDNQLNKNLFFSLGDLYLKECMHRFPKSNQAKNCFEAYKQEITVRYTGTLGTDIPMNKQNELKELKKLLK